jgi:uncharacterized protein YlaN (UPF0358 family)
MYGLSKSEEFAQKLELRPVNNGETAYVWPRDRMG